MIARTVALTIALLCSGAVVAQAQDAKIDGTPAKAAQHRDVGADADQYREALEVNAARVAVGNNLATAAAAQPSRAQLFGILLLMSLERHEANTGVRR